MCFVFCCLLTYYFVFTFLEVCFFLCFCATCSVCLVGWFGWCVFVFSSAFCVFQGLFVVVVVCWFDPRV